MAYNKIVDITTWPLAVVMTSDSRAQLWFNHNVSKGLIETGRLYLSLKVYDGVLYFAFSNTGTVRSKCVLKNKGTQVTFGRKWVMPYVFAAAGDKACFNHITILLSYAEDYNGDICYGVRKVIDYSNQKYKSSFASLQSVLKIRAANSPVLRKIVTKEEREREDELREFSYQLSLVDKLRKKYNG